MKPTFTVTLPLKLGSDIPKNTPKGHSSILSTHEIECVMTVPIKAMMTWSHSSLRGKLSIQNSSLQNNILQIQLEQKDSNPERQTVTVDCDINKAEELSLFPFRIALAVTQTSFKVRITKLSLQYQLLQLPKPKFVKNERLLNLGKDHNNLWGLLTMDQSHRIVLQDQNSSFPAIGLWLTGKELDPSKLLQRLSSYCDLKLNKKCLFTQDSKQYFYLAKCQSDCKTPEVYLIQLTPPKQNFTSLEYPLQHLSNKYSLTFRSDQHSHLEFTLRSDEKIPQKLQNIECSPILFQEDSSGSNEEPDSPRFKNNGYNPWELECASLRRLVTLQQHQINQLRSELMRVTNCFRQSQYTSVKHNPKSRPKGKILTEKDLSLGSPSHPSTSTSSNEQPEDWNAWERFQIVDK